MKKQQYVEFAYPGILFSDTDSLKIKSRKEKVKPNPRAYAYRFFERTEGFSSGEKLTGERKNVSGWFFLGGKVKTKDEVLKEQPDSILASNMKNSNIKRVVITKFGQAMEMEKKDTII